MTDMGRFQKLTPPLQLRPDVIAGVVHPAQFLLLTIGELGLLATQLALGTRDRHPFARAQLDEVRLKLGEGGEDIEEQLFTTLPGKLELQTG